MEIERKFLVEGDFKSYAYDHEEIAQGYLNSSPERVVRVRLKGARAYLTIKGATDASGTSRYEWEHEIDRGDAEELLRLCEPNSVIEKTRYYIRNGQHLIEVDEFAGTNQGLVIAEIELNTPDEPFIRPAFLAKEVTGDPRYYNSQLARIPYSEWVMRHTLI